MSEKNSQVGSRDIRHRTLAARAPALRLGCLARARRTREPRTRVFSISSSPVRVLITGGAGFLGQALTRHLLQRGRLRGADGSDQPIEGITLVDAAAAPPLRDTDRITQIAGDVTDRAMLESAIDTDTSAVFHLAAVVSGQAEADFDLGMSVNVDGTRTLLEACRARGHRPRVVFASSVAVFGGDLPPVVL